MSVVFVETFLTNRPYNEVSGIKGLCLLSCVMLYLN